MIRQLIDLFSKYNDPVRLRAVIHKHRDIITKLRLENAQLRAENRQLRRRLRDADLRLLRQAETDAVLMVGEIGGPQEAEAGLFAKEHMKKPVIAYIAGLSAPKGRRMGHAGAIVSAFGESAAEKVEILKGCGVTIAPTPSEMGSTVAQVLGRMKKVA